ncbi:LrgB family protein [Streptobacillus canis]|uniref:LrgB family protein n=1 Tax=Streptobacillus canis TaxID=2678686 RepID=UPI0012E0FFE7|nr:LrgB family protein [Streptobacillus canis]
MLFELTNDPLFGLLLTLLVYILFKKISEKVKLSLLNPIVLSIVLIIIILRMFNIPYENYFKGAEILNRMIVPATVALAMPLYKNFHLLKKYYKQILTGIGISTLLLTFLLGLIIAVIKIDSQILASILPKSVTTAIAVGVSEKINGITSITIITVIVCGNIGAIFGESVFKMFNITNPIAQGISLGTTSHAIGTSKAIEMGEVQGSMSGLAIIITGLFTVLIVPIIYLVIINFFY